MIGKTVKYGYSDTLTKGTVVGQYQGVIQQTELWPSSEYGVQKVSVNVPHDFFIVQVGDELKHVRADKIKEVVTYASANTGPR